MLVLGNVSTAHTHHQLQVAHGGEERLLLGPLFVGLRKFATASRRPRFLNCNNHTRSAKPASLSWQNSFYTIPP
jgi:hypothetical protein